MMEKILKWMTLTLAFILVVGGFLLAFHKDVFGAEYYKLPLATPYMGLVNSPGVNADSIWADIYFDNAYLRTVPLEVVAGSHWVWICDTATTAKAGLYHVIYRGHYGTDTLLDFTDIFVMDTLVLLRETSNIGVNWGDVTNQSSGVTLSGTSVGVVLGVVSSNIVQVGGDAIVDNNDGRLEVNVEELHDDAQSLLDLKDFADAGYDPDQDTINGIRAAVIEMLTSYDAATGTDIAGLNDIAAVDVWNVLFNTAFTVGSMGDSLTNSSYVQGAASGLTLNDIVNGIFDADLTTHNTDGTLGKYADTTISSVSLTGTGQYPCSLLVKNTAGGIVPSLGLRIVSDAGTGSGTPTSNSSGWALASLDNGTYYVYASNPAWTTTTPACTLSFASGTHYNDTMWATAYDFGTGATGALCNVYVVVTDNSGNAVSGITFAAKLNRARARVITAGYYLTGYAVSDTTDASGIATLPLYVNDSIVSVAGTAMNTKYIFSLTDTLGQSIIDDVAAEVPGDSAGTAWELIF